MDVYAFLTFGIFIFGVIALLGLIGYTIVEARRRDMSWWAVLLETLVLLIP